MASGSPFCMALKTALPADARYAVELQWRQSKCSSTTGTEKVVRQRSVWPWAVDWMYCNVEQQNCPPTTETEEESKQDIGWSDHRSLPLFWGKYSLTTGPYPYSEANIVWPQVLTLILRYCLTTGLYPDSELLSDRMSLSPFLTGWMFVCPNILWTLWQTMIRFLIELLVHRIWFGQSKLYFILNWLVMRCKLRPELAADVQQTAWSKM